MSKRIYEITDMRRFMMFCNTVPKSAQALIVADGYSAKHLSAAGLSVLEGYKL